MRMLALVAALYGAAIGQSGAPSIAGTWTAQLEGRTFIRLELAGANGAVKGGIALGNFELDKTGVVRKAADPPRDLRPISDVTQRQSVTSFLVAGTDEPDRFEFKLIDADHAELTLLIADDDREELAEMGIPVPRPIPLTRR
jgi:hypothetical protein